MRVPEGTRIFLQVYHGDVMSRVGEKNVQQVGGGDAEAAVIFAGVAAKPLGFVDLPIHQKADMMVCVVHEPQHAGGAGGAAQKRLHGLGRGERQA